MKRIENCHEKEPFQILVKVSLLVNLLLFFAVEIYENLKHNYSFKFESLLQNYQS